MYVLCLFVVLAALFITVLNSRTANHLHLGENGFSEYTSPGPLDNSFQSNPATPSSTTTALQKENPHPTPTLVV